MQRSSSNSLTRIGSRNLVDESSYQDKSLQVWKVKSKHGDGSIYPTTFFLAELNRSGLSHWLFSLIQLTMEVATREDIFLVFVALD